MKALYAFAFLQLASAAVDIRTVRHHARTNAIPGSYIVKLGQNSHLKRGFSSPHAELYHDLEKRSACWSKNREYSDSLFTGAAVKICGEADLVKLAQASGVEAIYVNYFHSVPQFATAPTTPPSINPTVIDKFSPHVMTGVNKVHAQGYFGKDITIGIIDTGIDYTHPALGGKFGPGNKIIGGYDFVGDAYTGRPDSPDPEPDNDPLDQCFGHGTHVAGIIGANPDNPYNISGVAYEASINAYRVVGCTGGYTDDVLVDALTRAYNDGNHIITLSLGGVDGWSEGVTSILASKIANKGRIVTAAAGNDGTYGAWYTSGPANGLSVISVGSVDNTIVNIQSAVVSTGRQVPYFSFIPLDVTGSLPIYATTNDTAATADACDPLPSTTPNLDKYLVVIRRGTCVFTQKLGNAAAFGARYFLVYDNLERPLSSVTLGNYTAALISQQDGIYLVKEAMTLNATITFGNNPSTLPSTTGGLMSSFSSYGPTYDMHFKPAISAPGGNILSTLPVALGSYVVESGTSMATPFVAGCAALWLQIRSPTPENAKAARVAFENAASLIPSSTTSGSLLETASRSGAGLIQIYDAIYNSGSMLPAELLLNDTANFQKELTLTIQNGGKKSATYDLTHVPAGTAPTIDGIENLLGPLKLVNITASVTIIPSRITVPPGSSAKVILSFKLPIGLDLSTFPVYSGFIHAKDENGLTFHSSYLGLAAALKDMKVIDNTDSYLGVNLPLITDRDGQPINGTTTYSMRGNDTPVLIYRLVAGSPLVRMDLINSNSNVTANQRRHNIESNVLSSSHVESSSKRGIIDWLPHRGSKSKLVTVSVDTFDETPTLGTLYSDDYVPRNSPAATAEDNGFTRVVITTFANGTAIPDGNYRILMRAAKITADLTEEQSYEVWTSPEIVVQRT